MPKIDRNSLKPYERSVYPGKLRGRTSGYRKLKLSDAGGLSQFGLGEVTLEPGGASGLFHWHRKEDELIYCLEGQLTVIEGEEVYTIGPGDCVTFKAGIEVGHTIENRSDRPARFLELGGRVSDEVAFYPGIDMQFSRNSKNPFSTRDGRPLGEDETPGPFADPHSYTNSNPRRTAS